LPASRVARAFAGDNYASAFRNGSYHGCLDALLTELREEHHRGKAS
jgi:glutamate-1-semialdehyde aminotransferase